MADESKDGLPILAFASEAAWETWLAAQPRNSNGIWLKLAKKSAETTSVSRQQAIDGALCHGWIDGQLAPYDEDFWLVRFTPRKPKGKWSEKNRTRAITLIEDRRMRPAGQAEIDAAKADGRWETAYAPQSTATVPDDLRAALDATPTAKQFFDGLDAANRYAILYRVHDAKTAKTRIARIEKFTAMLARGETIHPRKDSKD